MASIEGNMGQQSDRATLASELERVVLKGGDFPWGRFTVVATAVIIAGSLHVVYHSLRLTKTATQQNQGTVSQGGMIHVGAS